MRAVVPAAAIQDRGAGLVLDKICRRFLWLELIWADAGCNAWQVEAAVAKVPPLRIEIVQQDFESLSGTLAEFVILASIQLARSGLPEHTS